MSSPDPNLNRLARNPWPWAIVTFFAIFITWTVGFIIFSTFNRVDLVTPDYYAEELRFQEQIERQERTQKLAGQVQVRYDPTLQSIRIKLPPGQAGQAPAGTIHLYRPSAAGLDQQLALEVNAFGEQKLDARQLSPGLWRVRMNWTANDQEYYVDEEVIIGRPPSA